MILLPLALSLALSSLVQGAIKAGGFADGGHTQVSAVMMFLGNANKILDKAENNAAQINGHPAWGAQWDINTHEVELMDFKSNTFCAAGMHAPNGSFWTFGGNGAIGPGPTNEPSQKDEWNNGIFDATYGDWAGQKAIRVLDSYTCDDGQCVWFDDPDVMAMQKLRWYAGVEATAEGRVVIIGGYVNGGYINRNYPNTDPAFSGGASEPTYELWPADGSVATRMEFMVKTSGLNSYAHAYMLQDGTMYVQANYSSIIWDWKNNVETPLPDLPGQIARVYPASGAVAMLPLTPENNYVPTILSCGGIHLEDREWGNFSWPFINTWERQASDDCQRITPLPEDGSAPVYVQDDPMPIGRTMGQFIVLPDGKMVVVNGGAMGTAGYSLRTFDILELKDMPHGQSLAAEPVGKPAMYDPRAAPGKRWTTEGFDESPIARLYHSSAILLPDASVLIAGSNPNVDVELDVEFPTTYKAEIWYPPYFAAKTRPQPKGDIPTTISYGGKMFEVTIPASSYSGPANDAAKNTIVSLVRPGFTTHAMNMGQRFMQLEHTYTVQQNGDILLHVGQAFPNANLLQPGPCILFFVVNGVPSQGTMVIVGNGVIGPQTLNARTALPESVGLDGVSGSVDSDKTSTAPEGGKSDSGKSNSNAEDEGIFSSKPVLIGTIVGGIVVLGILGAIVGICLSRRRRAKATADSGTGPYAMSNVNKYDAPAVPYGQPARPYAGERGNTSSSFIPLKHGNESWAASDADLHHPQQPYRDYDSSGRSSAPGSHEEYYTSKPMDAHVGSQQHRGY